VRSPCGCSVVAAISVTGRFLRIYSASEFDRRTRREQASLRAVEWQERSGHALVDDTDRQYVDEIALPRAKQASLALLDATRADESFNILPKFVAHPRDAEPA
jgi:hypothetical protein